MSALRSFSAAAKEAIIRGCHVELPASNELFVDIDSAADMDRFETVFPILKDRLGATYTATVSPSGKPWRFHIRVLLNIDLSELERLALQAALGSDGKREVLGFLRYYAKDSDPITTFFEKDQ